MKSVRVFLGELFGKVGRYLISKIDYYMGVSSLSVFSLLQLFKKHSRNKVILLYRSLVKQVFFTAYQAIKYVVTISMAIGLLIIVIQSQVVSVISTETISDILIILIFREIIPLITGIVIISRSCSAIAVEIATITVNKEFELLVSMGIDPLYFIVLPRITGMIVSFFVLTIISSFVLLILSALIAFFFLSINSLDLINKVISSLKFRDILMVSSKILLFGFILPSLSCYHGFRAKNQNFIPVAATQAIMASLFYLLFVNVLISIVFYFTF